MRHLVALLCLIATFVAPLLRQTGAASLVARVVETASPADGDDDLESPIEEADDAEEAAVRLTGRRDLLSDPRSIRQSWGRELPPDPTAPLSVRRRHAARSGRQAAAAWPADGAPARHAWLQVFLF